jgi:hypothetical protein
MRQSATKNRNSERIERACGNDAARHRSDVERVNAMQACDQVESQDWLGGCA